MADVENPELLAEAEPAECSRHLLLCATGFLFLAFFCVFTHTAELQESHPETTSSAVNALSLLALLGTGCFGFVFLCLVADWVRACVLGPDGTLLVDDLLQSDRFILREFVHQYMRRIDPPAGDA